MQEARHSGSEGLAFVARTTPNQQADWCTLVVETDNFFGGFSAQEVRVTLLGALMLQQRAPSNLHHEIVNAR